MEDLSGQVLVLVEKLKFGFYLFEVAEIEQGIAAPFAVTAKVPAIPWPAVPKVSNSTRRATPSRCPTTTTRG